MRNIKIIFILILLIKTLSSQITESAKGYNACVNYENLEFKINNYHSGVLKVNKQITIYNQNGDKYVSSMLYENKFTKIKKIKGEIDDLNGKRLKKIKKEDITKINVSPGFVLYDDNKYQIIDLEWHTYPYVILFEYEIEFKSLYFWPDWYPQYDIPVKKSSYTLILNHNVPYKTYSIGLNILPTESYNNEKKVVKWELTDIEPRHHEDHMPPENRIQKAIFFVPERFDLDGYTGSFETWNSYGLWCKNVYKNRGNLTREIKEEIKHIIEDSCDNRTKISHLYKYLQDNTRYVAIELGIGGIQPSLIEDICTNKYGDCKDLSSFMISMALEAGIKAYPVLVQTRDSGVPIIDFPADYFNHVIVTIPLNNDTIWLECTAENLIAGDLPPSVEGCDVLVIKDSGGELQRTPQSTADDNKSISKVEGQLLNDGTIFFNGRIFYYGNSGYKKRRDLREEDKDKQKEFIASTICDKNTSQLLIQDYSIKNCENNLHLPLYLEISGKLNRYAKVSSNRIFLNANLLNKLTAQDIPTEEERQFPIRHSHPYMTLDTLNITIPRGYQLEAAPEHKSIKASFGKYKLFYELKENNLRFIRMLCIDKYLIPPSEYTDYLTFINTAVKNDKSCFVFRKVD